MPTEAQAQLVHEALAAHNYDDWYDALLSAALDKLRDLPQAILVAGHAYKAQPTDPSSPKKDDARWFLSTIGKPPLQTNSNRLSPAAARRLASNIFCPTGDKGGIDPSCTYSEHFEMARQRASKSSADALAASRKIPHSTLRLAEDAAVASDRAMSAPAAKVQEMHGEASDAHWRAVRAHEQQARGIELAGRERSRFSTDKTAQLHREAEQAHRKAVLMHTIVSGRREEAKRLTKEAIEATRAMGWEPAGLDELQDRARFNEHQHANAAHSRFVDWHTGNTEGSRRAREAHLKAAGAHYHLWMGPPHEPTGNKSSNSVFNIFCPTGEGGGIDPTCTRSDEFDKARDRASRISTEALQATQRITARDSASRAASRRAIEAAALGDRAAEAPIATAQQRHGEAADAHFKAAQYHDRAYSTRPVRVGGPGDQRELHREASIAHMGAVIAHEFVSGRHEEAHRLSQEAHRLSMHARDYDQAGSALDYADRSLRQSEERHHLRAGQVHEWASSEHDYYGNVAAFEGVTPDLERQRRHRAAAQAHRKAADAHYDLYRGVSSIIIGNKRRRRPTSNANPDQPRDDHGRWTATEHSLRAYDASRSITDTSPQGVAAWRAAQDAAVASDRAIDQTDPHLISIHHRRAAHKHYLAGRLHQEAHRAAEARMDSDPNAYQQSTSHSVASEVHSRAGVYHSSAALHYGHGNDIFASEAAQEASNLTNSREARVAASRASWEALNGRRETAAQHHDEAARIHHSLEDQEYIHRDAAKAHELAAKYHRMIINAGSRNGSPLVNADPNCGTGAGGFQPGNTCGAGRGGGGGGGSKRNKPPKPKKVKPSIFIGSGRFSGVRVKPFYPGDIDEVLSDAKEMVGFDRDQLLGLVGAQPGAEVSVHVPHFGQPKVIVNVNHPTYRQSRTIYQDHIHNDNFYTAHKGGGTGLKVFADQVAEAIKHPQLKYIDTFAAGQHGSDMNGYFSWPRMGYDARIANNIDSWTVQRASQLTGIPADQVKLSDLMRTPQGRDFWRLHGSDIPAVFDLAKGSLSRHILQEYIHERIARGGRVAPLLRGMVVNVKRKNYEQPPDFDATDEEILDAIWDRVGTDWKPGFNRDAINPPPNDLPQQPPAANIFCPTGGGGGIDPSCTYSEAYEMARTRATEQTARALEASRNVGAQDKSSRGRAAMRRAQAAAVASDRAAAAPGHLAEKLHGEATDAHIRARNRHMVAAVGRGGRPGTHQYSNAHSQAANLHHVAAVAHERVSGRYEAARELSVQAQAASSLTSVDEAVQYARQATSLATDRLPYSASGAHQEAAHIHRYYARHGGEEHRQLHQRAAEAHEEAMAAQERMYFRPVRNTSTSVSNVFCPTGKGGGIDPSCTHSDEFHKAREDASAGSSDALRHSQSIPYRDSTSRAALARAVKAAAASDTAMDAPAAKMQHWHGEASDAHFLAMRMHERAAIAHPGVGGQPLDTDASRARMNVHMNAAQAHRIAGNRHLLVSGRREEARRLSEEAIEATKAMGDIRTVTHSRASAALGYADMQEHRNAMWVHDTAEQSHRDHASSAYVPPEVRRADLRAARAHHKARTAHLRLWQGPVENVANADCGTGAGGFKPGNTCASGGPHPPSKSSDKGRKMYEAAIQRAKAAVIPPNQFSRARFLAEIESGRMWRVMASLEAAAVPMGAVNTHSMSKAEDVKGVEIDGTRFVWVPSAQGAAVNSIARLMAESPDIPEAMWKSQTQVVFSSQPNKDNERWAKQYGYDHFEAASTGGDGKSIVVYSNKLLSTDTFNHEAGHNFAMKLWGSTIPARTSNYIRAATLEPPVSKYALKSDSLSEDFAEACRLYGRRSSRPVFCKQFPAKCAVLRELITPYERQQWTGNVRQVVSNSDTTESHNHLTPNGGVRSQAIYSDGNFNPVPRAQATHVEILEFDAAGEVIARTYAEIAASAAPLASKPGPSPVGNVEDCGTGAGGFKKGNTCASGSKSTKRSNLASRVTKTAYQHAKKAVALGLSAAKAKFVGKPSGKAETDAADVNEQDLASAIGGVWMGSLDKAHRPPVDVKKGRHGIEVKTIFKKEESVISVHPDALLRKVAWQNAEPGRTFHTVVFDDRDVWEGGKYSHLHSGHRIYYKRGSDRYHLNKMYQASSMEEVGRLIAMKDEQLPEAARGRLPTGQAELNALREQADKAHAARKIKDRTRKQRIRAAKRGEIKRDRPII